MDEEAFLRTILLDPKDDATRLIYADWLDEQGDGMSVRKALYLRFICRGVTETKSGGVIANRQRKLELLSSELSADWIAVIGKMQIENCKVKGKTKRIPLYWPERLEFEFVCTNQWEDLASVEANEKVRWCKDCQKEVYYGATPAEVKHLAREGKCVAVNPSAKRKSLPESDFGNRRMRLGKIVSPRS